MSLATPGRSRLGRYIPLFIASALVAGQSCLDLGGQNANRPQHLGVFTQDTTIGSVGGVLITGIVPGGATAQAGILPNDILARLDGRVITGVSDMRQKVAGKSLGQSIRLVRFRSSDLTLETVDVPIGANAAGSLPNVLGFAVAAGTNALRVTALAPGGVAELGGLKVDDQIVSVNGVPTTTLADAWRIFAPFSTGSLATLTFTRANAPTTQPGTTPSFSLTLTAGSDAAPWLAVPGLYVQDLTPTLAAHFKYITTTGAQVTNLYRESPAFKAGLLVGDIIIGLTPLDPVGAEQAVTTATGLSTLVQNQAGKRVRVRYLRGQLPPSPVDIDLAGGVPADAAQAPVIGMLLEQLTDTSGNPAGLRVEQVTSGGPAAAAGIVREDRITQVDGNTVRSLSEFWTRLLAQYDSDNLNVVMQATPQQGAPRFVVLKLAAVE